MITPQLSLAAKLRDRIILRQIAEAGIKRAIIEIRADETDGYDVFHDAWSANEDAFKEIQLADGRYFSVKYTISGGEDAEDETAYGLIDEERKINLNTATADVLKELLELAAEASSQEAVDIADAIIDWRDEDDEPSDNGAESSYYEGLSPGYICKNADFDLLEELFLVKGMTQTIYDKVKDYLTVYGDGKVNLNTADGLVLQSLGMRSSLAEKVISFRKGDDGKSGTEDDNAFNSTEDAGLLLSSKVGLNAEETNEFIAITEGDLAGVQSNNFRGVSTGALQDQELETSIVFVINRDEQIRYWRQQ
jgi:type II secretory pathway component PulK